MLCSPHVRQSIVFICDLLFIWKWQERRQKADHCYLFHVFSSPVLHSQALLYGCTSGTIALLCVKFAILSGMEARLVISGKTFSESTEVFVQETLCRYQIRMWHLSDGWSGYWMGVLNHHCYYETISIEPYNMGTRCIDISIKHMHTLNASQIDSTICVALCCVSNP